MDNIEVYEANNKIKLTEEERLWANEQINYLFKSFDELSSIDTSDVSPLISVVDISNIMREDVALQEVSRETLLSTAHTNSSEYFEIPRIL